MSPPQDGPRDRRITVVVITRDRRERVLTTLPRLLGLRPRPRVVLVDNDSRDGTADAVRTRFPGVEVVAAGTNLGSAGRTLGVRAARTPYVAFADDDSWWAPGALDLAADVLDAVPRLAVVAASVTVQPQGEPDPLNTVLAEGRAGTVPGAGPRVTGFVACGAVVRREAYLQAGGFHPRYGVGGEEQLLAVDLLRAGWDLAHVPDVVAEHAPAGLHRPGRSRTALRNDLWTALLRRPARVALAGLVDAVRTAPGDPATRGALSDVVAALPWLVRDRRRPDPDVERLLRAVAGDAAAQAAAQAGRMEAPVRGRRRP
ncbi:glycosyltransferase family 2 protein [Thalassiella azotivora]